MTEQENGRQRYYRQHNEDCIFTLVILFVLYLIAINIGF